METAVPLSAKEDELQSLWAPDFDFDGVEVKVKVDVATNKEQGDSPSDFMVTVVLQVPNGEIGKKAPYTVDVNAIGWFSLAPGVSDDREEIVRVNGASLLLGAVRELVCTITARSALGVMTLPTLRIIPKTSPKPAQEKAD